VEELARARLRELVQSRGSTLAEDPRLVAALLRDACPDYRLEITVIVAAAEEGIPQRLRQTGSSLGVLVPQSTDLLVKNRGLSRENARWATEAWAFALGLTQQDPAADEPRKPVPDTTPVDQFPQPVPPVPDTRPNDGAPKSPSSPLWWKRPVPLVLVSLTLVAGVILVIAFASGGGHPPVSEAALHGSWDISGTYSDTNFSNLDVGDSFTDTWSMENFCDDCDTDLNAEYSADATLSRDASGTWTGTGSFDFSADQCGDSTETDAPSFTVTQAEERNGEWVATMISGTIHQSVPGTDSCSTDGYGDVTFTGTRSD
jgi:hypothetical protein